MIKASTKYGWLSATALGAGVFYAALTGAALAQTPAISMPQDNARTGGEGHADIVVVARKRSESLQDVPLSVSALDAQMLDKANASTLADINTVPNVEISTTSVQPTGLVTFIRGIGNKAQEVFIDTPIAISIDGVYLPISSGALIDLFDVQQVEILRGPQGTLQGRNSPGGAINVTTRRPTGKNGVEAQLGYGIYNTVDAKLAIDTSLIEDRLAIRASFMASNGEGALKNLTTGERQGGREVYSGRLSLLFSPSDEFKLFVSGDFAANRSDQTGLRAANTSQSYLRQPAPLVCALLGECSADKAHRTRSDFTKGYKADFGGVSATATYDAGAANLTSVTGYRFFNEKQNIDIDGLPVPILHIVDRALDLDMFSQEMRLSSGPGSDLDGRLNWVIGGIYYRSEWQQVQPVSVFGNAPVVQLSHQTLDSYGLFGQASVDLVDNWSVSAGLRQSWDKKRFDGVPSGFAESSRVFVNRSFDNLSIELGTEYKITPRHLVYIRFAQGYRSGGINGGAANPADVNSFDPEKVNSYEIGFKTQWFDRALTINGAVFHADYQDLQRDTLQTSASGQGFANIVANAANARIRGGELEIAAAPVSGLTLSAGVGYLDAKYKNFMADIVGNGVVTDNSDLRLPFTPKWSLSGGIEYIVPLNDGKELSVRANAVRKTSHTVTPSDIQVAYENGYTVVDVATRLQLASIPLSIEIFANNLFDEKYIVAGENVSGLVLWQVDGPARTVGIKASLSL